MLTFRDVKKAIRKLKKGRSDGTRSVYFPQNCITCLHLRYRFKKKKFVGYRCRCKPELKGDYETCEAKRMDGCPITEMLVRRFEQCKATDGK